MVVSTEVAGLAMSIVSGSIKLGRKLDEMMAAQEADASPLSLPFSDVAGAPTLDDLAAALDGFVQRSGELSDAERQKIRDAIATPRLTPLMRLCEKHGLMESISISLWSPDRDFQAALLKHRRVWNLDEQDIRRATYYLAAGPSARRASLGFRIAATALDVVAEVVGQNARHLTDHEPTRELIEAVLTRFSEPDLETMDGWGQVLEHALRSTLAVVVDQRESLARGNVWIERTLSALARARDADGGDDFVLGLLRGSGYPSLVGALLEESADLLSDGDEEVWESILADVLTAAAGTIEPTSRFESWFQEHWHVLVGAGLGSLHEHGPRLLDDDELLASVLKASVGALADAFDEGPPPGPEVLDAAVRAAAAVFADPAVLAGRVGEEWLRELIASTAGVLADDRDGRGLRAAFSRGALERYARGALEVLSDYPEVVGADAGIVRAVLSDVLGAMARVETFGLLPLADVAVEGALTALADNPELFESRYAGVLGELAGTLAEQVARNGLSNLQARDLLEAAAVTLATNDALFVEARDGLARAVVSAVLDAANGDERGLLAGSALVGTITRALDAVAVSGLDLPAAADAVAERLREAVAEALRLADAQLGHRLAQRQLPDLLVELVIEIARPGPPPTPGTPAFDQLFALVLERVATTTS